MPSWYAIHLKTKNVKATADWYMKLGLQKRRDYESRGARTIVLETDGFPLVITQHSDAESLPGVPTTIFLGIEHFGFSVDDFDAQLERFKEEGVELFPESRLNVKAGERVAFVHAPDGVRLELTDAPWQW